MGWYGSRGPGRHRLRAEQRRGAGAVPQGAGSVPLAAFAGHAAHLGGVAALTQRYFKGAEGSGYNDAKQLLERTGDVSPAYGLCNMLMPFVSFISGIPGGLFAPSLSAGAGIGQAVADRMTP